MLHTVHVTNQNLDSGEGLGRGLLGSSIIFGSHNVMGESLGTRLCFPSGGIVQVFADK